ARGLTTVENSGQEDKYLCAFVVPGEGKIDTTELKRYLRETLPDYMNPALFVVLEKLPLTPNGKIDKKALSKHEIKREPTEDYVAPQTEMEETIAAIWREVLKIDTVGVKDNYFEIGGHSLNIIQLNTKLKNKLQKDISIAAMFRYPTISAQVEYFCGETGKLSEDAEERIADSVDMMDEATDVLFADELD
ncbi:MAG: hypothetical protein GY757_10945, partial [bacterium]|nr:hypothetical protein [bacterium]